MSLGPSAAPAGCTPHHRRHRPRTVMLRMVLHPCIMRRSGSPTAAPLRTNHLHKDPSAAPPPAVGVRGSVCVMPSFLGWSTDCLAEQSPGRAGWGAGLPLMAGREEVWSPAQPSGLQPQACPSALGRRVGCTHGVWSRRACGGVLLTTEIMERWLMPAPAARPRRRFCCAVWMEGSAHALSRQAAPWLSLCPWQFQVAGSSSPGLAIREAEDTQGIGHCPPKARPLASLCSPPTSCARSTYKATLCALRGRHSPCLHLDNWECSFALPTQSAVMAKLGALHKKAEDTGCI